MNTDFAKRVFVCVRLCPIDFRSTDSAPILSNNHGKVNAISGALVLTTREKREYNVVEIFVPASILIRYASERKCRGSPCGLDKAVM